MYTCPNCSAEFAAPGDFCTRCGKPMLSHTQPEVISPQKGFTPEVSKPSTPDQATATGLGRIFGLHAGVAFFTVAVNMMLFGKDGLALALAPVTGGADLPPALVISVLAGAAVAYINYLGQKKWYGDDHESAKIKALITGVLTAIPTGLPGMLFGSVALAGVLFGKKRQGSLS
jgi:hypothetical protein